jgi:hypothetical protein
MDEQCLVGDRPVAFLDRLVEFLDLGMELAYSVSEHASLILVHVSVAGELLWRDATLSQHAKEHRCAVGYFAFMRCGIKPEFYELKFSWC